MQVRDLMQVDVRTVDDAAHLDVVDELMREEVIRHLPVVSGQKLVGIVTQRDLFRSALSSALRFAPATEQEWLAELPVRSVMTRRVLHAHPDADLGSALELMLRQRVGCLPVVEDERVVGLLSETDCLRHLAEALRSGKLS